MTTPDVIHGAEQSRGTLVLTGDNVRDLLSMPECIEAVERAFLRHAQGGTIPPDILGAPVEGGGFHVKTAGMLGGGTDERSVFVAKVNANFPGNPAQWGLPTIQGVVAVFDAVDGRLLALLDSIEITSIRTAAATAVAAKYLARTDAATVTVCGCGEQGRSQLRALACVRPLRRAMAFDMNPDRAQTYAAEMSAELGIDVTAVRELGDATRGSDIWVTCTPARRWFLGRDNVAPGVFIAAVGADNPKKQEIEPQLLAQSTVVADSLDQCATIGDLHHALNAGVMRREEVHAELAEIVSGRKRGRESEDEVIVFDSTGTALQDIAAALLVYERALAASVGLAVNLGGRPSRVDAGAKGAMK